MKKINLTEELNDSLYDFLANHEREITERILTDILCRLYFMDCNRECDYSKMQASDIVMIYHEQLEKIEKDYNFDLAIALGY